MLETSKDLLYIVIAFCVIWLTAFMCWALYYVIMLLRQVYSVTHGIQKKIEKLEFLADLLKSKLEKSASHLGSVAEGIGDLVKYLINSKIVKEVVKKKKK